MRNILFVLILAIVVCSGGCEQREAKVTPSGRVVKIGVIAPMSGPDKRSGENAVHGVQTALLMQPYLKNGDRIELVIEDNHGASENTLDALKKLHGQQDVVGVLLMAKSDIVLSLVPIADEYGIPILALIATHPDITKNNRFITQLGFDDIHQGTVAALYVRDEMLIDRIAVISDPDNTHYTFLTNAFIQEFTSAGGEIVELVIDGSQSTDLSGILKELQGKNVQLLYLAVSPKRVVEISREAGVIGWKPKMMGTDGLLTNILLYHEEDIPLIEGMMATDFYSSIIPKTEYGRKAARLFRKQFSEPVTTYSGLGCEGTSLLLNAMNHCSNEIHRSCVNLMLRNTKVFEGLLGRISIHEDGKTERPVIVNEIEDQEMKFLVKVY